MSEFCLGDAHKIFNGGTPRRNAMRLLQLDERLIEASFANELRSLVQRRGLRTQQGRQCNENKGGSNHPRPSHCFAPRLAASSAEGAAIFSSLIAFTRAKTLTASAVLPSARRTSPS